MLIEIFQDWINTWIFTIEREHQYLDSVRRFKIKLKDEREALGPNVHDGIKQICSILEENSTKWAKCYKKSVLDIEQCTSSIGESANSSLKRFDKSRSMAQKSLATSASTQIRHSEHLEGKRQSIAATSLNTSLVMQFMKDQSLLTIHCQKMANDIYVRKHHYLWVRDRANSWLVCHRNTFALNDEENILRLMISRYSNVHRVSIVNPSPNTSKTYIHCESCKKRARMGIPCPHVTSVLGFMHAQMFHPIYLASYNSWVYENNDDLKGPIKQLLDENDSFPAYCDVTGILDLTEFIGIEYSGGANIELYKKMRSLETMHFNKKPLLRGLTPEDIELENENNLSNNDTIETQFDCVVEHDFDHDIGEEVTDNRKQKKQKVTEKSEREVETHLYSVINSWAKDILKVTNDSKERMVEIEKMLNKTLADEKRRQLVRMNIKPSTNESGIVSSSAETETAKRDYRYKKGREKH